MKKISYILVVFSILCLVEIAVALPAPLIIDFESTSDPCVTGGHWQACGASGTSCGGMCCSSTIASDYWNHKGEWEDGYTFDSPYTGQVTCTLTVRAQGFSVTQNSGYAQTNEIVQGKVNGVVFDATEDRCTGLGETCQCDIETSTDTRTVTLQATGNVVTVRRYDSVDVKGARLVCWQEQSCEYTCTEVGDRTYGTMPDGTPFDYTDYCDGTTYHDYYCDDGIFSPIECYGNVGEDTYPCDLCVDDCNYLGQRQCADDATYKICGDYDSDSCLDWKEVECTGDGYCDDGYCEWNSCQDECDEYGDRECTGDDGYRICGNYDNDDCLEWDYRDCDSGEECSRGYCEDECDSGYENEYQCDGNWLQRLYLDNDCDEDWRDYEYCEDGCRNDECRDDNDCEWDCSPCDHSCIPCNPCQGNNCNICPYQNYCGDRMCNNGETCYTCPTDCGSCQPQNYCGNGICSNGETCTSCPADCGACQPQMYCGDGSCNNGESCSTCQTDCGSCAPQTYCGDGWCSIGETCSNCQTDCGMCIVPDVVDPNDLCTATQQCNIDGTTDTGSNNNGGGNTNSNYSPSGAIVIGEIDWFWTAIWFLVVINILLFVIIVLKKLGS